MSMVELVSKTTSITSTTTPRKRKHHETVDSQDMLATSSFCPDDFINYMNDLVGQDCSTLDLTQLLFDAQNQSEQGNNSLSIGGDVAAAPLLDNASDPLSLASFAPPSSVIFDHGDNNWMASDWLLLASEGLGQPPSEEASISPPLVASSPTESSLSTSLSSSSHSPPPLPIDISKLTITMAMEQYLSRPSCKLYPLTEASASATLSGERTVWIMTGKVAQKSYGSEKRFLSPPPVTLLLGTPWWTQQQCGKHDEEKDDGIFIHHKPISRIRMTPPSLSIHMSTNNEVVPGTLEWYDAATRAQASSSTAISDPGAVYGRCIAKHLHINDAAEKRKQVSVLIDIQLDNHRLGTFPSKDIKVISKPSKKKQSSAKHMDLYIHHGSTIALFNRIRSQTVSTKYLGVSYSNQENHCFVTRPGSWDPFVIWVVKQDAANEINPNQQPSASYLPHHPHNPYYPPPPEAARPMGSNLQVIHYNQRVILQCIATGLTSPVMVIRRVDKGSRVLGGEGLPHDEALGDPVSQLHRIAFEIVPEAGQEKMSVPSFLSCTADQVGTYEATSERKMISDGSKAGASWSLDVSDTAMWTVIGTDCSIYSFWAPPSTPGTFITPFPAITHLAALPQQQLTLTGTNLSGLSVWFGNLKAIMETQSDTSISCRVPSVQELIQSPACTFNQVEGRHSIPIWLVRESNCIVYRTDKFYFF